MPFERLDPLLALLERLEVEVDSLAFGHHDETIHVLLGIVLKIMLLDSAIFDVEYACLNRSIFRLNKKKVKKLKTMIFKISPNMLTQPELLK